MLGAAEETCMHEYLIALGANLGDREYYIEQAIEAIRTSCGPIRALSQLHETPALGAAEGLFLNAILVVQSSEEPEQILKMLMKIEADLGRVRTVRWGNRTIDCDIILWRRADGSFPVFQSPQLSIPHPEAHKRSFVLDPAVEIAADWMHPLLGLNIRQLWQSLPREKPSAD